MQRHSAGRPMGPFLILAGLVLALVGCGSGDAGADSAEDTSPSGGLEVCGLLLPDEVTALLPGHDGGVETRSGESLVEGTSVYQCSYTAQGAGPADLHLLTLTATVASTPDVLAEVRPAAETRRDRYEIFSEVDAGDGGFSYGDAGDFMVDVWQGARLVSIELAVSGAADREDDLVALAVAALSRIE